MKAGDHKILSLPRGDVIIRSNVTNEGYVVYNIGKEFVFKKRIGNLRSWFYMIFSVGEGKILSEIDGDVEVFDYFPEGKPRDEIVLYGTTVFSEFANLTLYSEYFTYD